jgi:hypothetical protein
MAYSMGLYCRIGDAVIPTFLLEWANFRIGVAYDITISYLRKANGYRGGMEFSIVYITPNPFSVKTAASKKRYDL